MLEIDEKSSLKVYKTISWLFLIVAYLFGGQPV